MTSPRASIQNKSAHRKFSLLCKEEKSDERQPILYAEIVKLASQLTPPLLDNGQIPLTHEQFIQKIKYNKSYSNHFKNGCFKGLQEGAEEGCLVGAAVSFVLLLLTIAFTSLCSRDTRTFLAGEKDAEDKVILSFIAFYIAVIGAIPGAAIGAVSAGVAKSSIEGVDALKTVKKLGEKISEYETNLVKFAKEAEVLNIVNKKVL